MALLKKWTNYIDKHKQRISNRQNQWLYSENSDKQLHKTRKLAEALKMFVLTLWGTLVLEFHPVDFSIFIPPGYIIDAMRKKMFVRHSKIIVYSYSKNKQTMNTHVVSRRYSGFCLTMWAESSTGSSTDQLSSCCLQITDIRPCYIWYQDPSRGIWSQVARRDTSPWYTHIKCVSCDLCSDFERTVFDNITIHVSHCNSELVYA